MEMDNNEHLFHIFLVAKKEQLQFKMKKKMYKEKHEDCWMWAITINENMMKTMEPIKSNNRCVLFSMWWKKFLLLTYHCHHHRPTETFWWNDSVFANCTMLCRLNWALTERPDYWLRKCTRWIINMPVALQHWTFQIRTKNGKLKI